MKANGIGYTCLGKEWRRDVASRTQSFNARKGRKEVAR